MKLACRFSFHSWLSMPTWSCIYMSMKSSYSLSSAKLMWNYSMRSECTSRDSLFLSI